MLVGMLIQPRLAGGFVCFPTPSMLRHGSTSKARRVNRHWHVAVPIPRVLRSVLVFIRLCSYSGLGEDTPIIRFPRNCKGLWAHHRLTRVYAQNNISLDALAFKNGHSTNGHTDVGTTEGRRRELVHRGNGLAWREAKHYIVRRDTAGDLCDVGSEAC